MALLLVVYAGLDVMAGASRSPLVPLYPPGARPPGWTRTLARVAGVDHLSPAAQAAMAIALLSLLVSGFLWLAREAWLGRAGVRLVVVSSAVCLALSVAAPLLLSRDVYSYADYGRIASVHGANPYVVPPSSFPHDPFVRVTSPQWLGTRSLYGPAFTLLGAGITRWAGRSTGAVLVSFKAMAGLCVFGACLLAAAACRRGRPERAAFAAAVIGLNPVVVVHAVGGGHSDTLIALLFGAALILWTGPGGTRRSSSAAPWERTWRAVAITVFLVLAALVKVVVGVAFAVWLWTILTACHGRERVRALILHGGLAVALTALFLAPFFAGWRTLSSLATLAGVQGWASGARLVARGASAIGGSAASTAVIVLFLLAFIGLFGRLLGRSLPSALPDRWGMSLLLLALTVPYLAPWYVAWFLPFLALLADDFFVVIGVALTCVVGLTGIPAEPGGSPGLWRDTLLAVHYVAAPVVLAMLVAAGARLLRPAAGRSSRPAWRRRERTPAAPPDPAIPGRPA